MFFQLQLSMLTENFDDLMDILGQRIHPNIAKGIDDFTDRLEETEEELGDAHPTCMREFQILIRRFGRDFSRCSFSGMYEIMWMQSYHQYLTWYSEYMSNAVPMEGMELFTYWDVLTDTVSDPIMIINNQLRDSLNLFLTDHNAELGWLENYVYDYFEDITFNSYFCPYSLIGRWFTATNNLLSDASDGPCVETEV
jgi:RNAse (barnase) inhibitor barstar